MNQTNDNLLTFILSGKATFTVTSAKTGQRFTYRVEAAESGTLWFVKVLTGSDNTSDYSYAGIITKSHDGGYGYKATAKSKVPLTAPSVRGFVWLLRRIQTCGIGEAATVDHMGKCGACGRALTVPESIELGLGPVCASKAA